MKHDLEATKQAIAKAASPEDRLRVLLESSIALYRSHPKDARMWADEALKLARKQKHKLDEARSLTRLGCASFQLCQFPRAEKDLTKAIGLFNAIDRDATVKGAALLALGMTYFELGKLRDAMKQYEEALRIYADKPSKRADVLIEMGYLARVLADYPRSLNLQYQALAILDETDDVQKRGTTLLNIAAIYLEVNDLVRADPTLERSLILLREADDMPNIVSVLYNKGVVAQKQGYMQRAREFYTDALSIAKIAERIDSEVYIEDSLGQMDLDANKPKSALAHFKRAVEFARQLKIMPVLSASLIGLGRAYIALGKFNDAIVVLKESLAMSIEEKMLALETDGTSAIANAYESAGRLKDSLKSYNRFIVLNAELNSQQRHRALVEIGARVEIEKAERERERMERLANDANERAELFSAESERQSKELTQLALQLVEKNQFLCDLKQEIEPSIKSSRKAQSLIERIDDHIRSDRDWETFEHQFDQVHRDFLKELSAGYPALTPTELKIAVMIKLNLPTKAIASLFCLSARTVENHRHSIRRKLRLLADDNLVSFLTAFGTSR